MHRLKCRLHEDAIREYLYDNERGLYFTNCACRTPNGCVDTAFNEVTRAQFVRFLLLSTYDLYKVDQVEQANLFYSTAMRLALDYYEQVPVEFMHRLNKARNEALVRAVEGR